MCYRGLAGPPAGARGGPAPRGRAGFCYRPVLLTALLALACAPALAQRGGNTLYGDVKVDDTKVEGLKPMGFDIILYYLDGRVHARQRVSNNGRYRFFGVRNGEYDLVVELETQEVARLRISVGTSGAAADVRQDIELEWKGSAGGGGPAKKQTVSAADFYERPAVNRGAFEKAQEALSRKEYDRAVKLLRQVTEADAGDFQAWTELGTAYLFQDTHGEAEKAYERALAVRPTFFLAMLNLGRARAAQKKFEESLAPLAGAVGAQPQSAEANLLLGEVYLQIKKGSQAVGYLNEAARLGRAEAHLRLAALYNNAGLKERAAAEYEQFLAKEPKHPEREKLEKYVREHKKP